MKYGPTLNSYLEEQKCLLLAHAPNPVPGTRAKEDEALSKSGRLFAKRC